MADGFEAVIVGMRGAGFGEKAARTLKVVAVAFNSRFLQTVGDPLALDDAERDVGPGFATGFQFANAVADFVQHGTFVQTFPRRHQADGGDPVFIRFFSGFLNRLGIHKTISGRAGLIKR